MGAPQEALKVPPGEVISPKLQTPDSRFSFAYFAAVRAYREMNGNEIRYFLGDLKDDETILDLCCANGNNAATILRIAKNRNLQVQVIGADINQNDLAIAVNAVPEAKFHYQDATALTWLDNVFDRAILLNAWHEIQGKSKRTIDGAEVEISNKDLVAQELHRVLKPGAPGMVITGFTKEVFDFESEGANMGRAARLEWQKHGTIRKYTMEALGETKDPEKESFEVLPTKAYIEKLKAEGFVDIQIHEVEVPLTFDDMLLIGMDSKWYDGLLGDMTNKEKHSYFEMHYAYHVAMRKYKAEWEEKNPGKELKFPRRFQVITFRKPLEPVREPAPTH